MSECKGCGTELKNCGAPIWEDYCPNKECHYEAEQFKERLRQAGEEMRRKKALEAAAPELYEALLRMKEWCEDEVGAELPCPSIDTALAKARGEV